jgi:hypothetical protein
LLYEMMTGIVSVDSKFLLLNFYVTNFAKSGIAQTPFWASDQNKMYRRVLEDKLEFPADMTFEAMDLLRGVSII